MMTENTYSEDHEKSKYEDGALLKSVRVTMNLVINILIFLTVFVCLLYSCQSEVTVFDLHIICCVLGYQFCMCQGTMIISQYNSWSMFIKRRFRRHIHWVMQVIAATLATAGTTFIVNMKNTHFTSLHGKLGLAALVCCLASLLNGILTFYAHKLCICVSVFWVRFFHYMTGIASMFLAAGSLCVAFQYPSFHAWTGNGNVFVPALTCITWLFTILVSLDYWIVMGSRIRRMFL